MPRHPVLRARMDGAVAMSARPLDMLPINGCAFRPMEAHYARPGPGAHASGE